MLYYVQMVHNRNDYIPKQLNMSKFIPSTAIFFFLSFDRQTRKKFIKGT